MSKNLSSILRGTNYGTLPISAGGTGGNTAATARTALDAQKTLVSGTDIKTLNGNSILGTGDITVAASSKLTIVNRSAVEIFVPLVTGVLPVLNRSGTTINVGAS
jgi:hypothetical protein